MSASELTKFSVADPTGRYRFLKLQNKYSMSQHTKTPSIKRAISEDSDQPVHPRSLIRVFADRMCLLHPSGYPKKDKREPLPNWVDVQTELRLCWSHRSFIANSSSCTTTVLSKLLTLCLITVKKHWIRYYDTVYERDGINYFWSIKNSNEILNKFKSKNFQYSKLSTYDFSTLYTT